MQARERRKSLPRLASGMPIVTGQARTRRFFDWLAPRYDVVNAVLFRPAWRERVRRAIRPGRVLDVGVGTGYTTGHVPEAVGIDLSRAMISRAKAYRGNLVLADATFPPFRPRSFSTIVCAGSFYYLPDPIQALRIFHGLLSDGGVIVMLGPEAWFLRPLVRIYDRAEYGSMAAATGFTLETCETLRGVACLVVMRKAA